MTSIEDVSFFMVQLSKDWPLAKLWKSNDIIKKYIAITYDDYLIENKKIKDDHELTLKEHIIYYLDTRDETFFNMKEPSE